MTGANAKARGDGVLASLTGAGRGRGRGRMPALEFENYGVIYCSPVYNNFFSCGFGGYIN